VIDRQKVIGWVLVAVSVAYLVYFWRGRLFEPGPVLSNNEWARVAGSIVVLMIGTINVRLAAMRERRRRGSSH
jgi:hypothetical protein